MHYAVERFVTDPLLVSLAFFLAICEAGVLSVCLSRMGGRFAQAVAPGAKVATIEGLRGILAFSVVVHHGCCWYFYQRLGVWGTGHSIAFGRLALLGVNQFFYISGYLFWRKLMRQGKIPLGRFYLSRLIRIGPVYYVCVGAAILIGLAVTGFALRVGLADLARSLASWLLFCLGGLPSVNGADTLRIIAGVTWTLAMEWGFYLLLPFLGWFSRRASRLFWLILVFGGAWLVLKEVCDLLTQAPHLVAVLKEMKEVAKFMLVGFGGGILVAVLEPQLRKVSRLSARQTSWMLLSFYLIYLFAPKIESIGQVFLLCGFAMVVLGSDMFGLITSRGVRLLGIVSYDIYVVHGIIYYLATRARGGIHPVPLKMYIPETLLCMMIVVIVATVMHFAVERPTMLISERIARPQAFTPVPAKSAGA
jgi:peptidoglycan/LPS O-acetylase OafA/YrhL